MKFNPKHRVDRLQTLVSSYNDTENDSLKIHQDARISRIDLSKNKDFIYQLRAENHGVYMMIISGDVSVDKYNLTRRDAVGVTQTSDFTVSANQKSEILFIEVPMDF
jgi:redox-sensitive bicupin YhaK (pirin superfamily)